MQTPLVSIITPSYNQGEFIEETILSVLNQTYKNIEYIIIDGGSNDNSVDVIKKYQSKLKYWVSEKDEGQADAINKGFQLASGDYLCWVNSDDLLYPNFIERRINEFSKDPSLEMIYGDVDQGVTLNSKVLRKGRQADFNSILKTGFIPIPQQSAIWRSKLINKVGLLGEKWHVLLDYDYFLRLSASSKIKYIPGSVAFFRNHEESKSVKLKTKWIEEIDLYLKDPILTSLIKDPLKLEHFKYKLLKWNYDLSIEIDNEDLKSKYYAILNEKHKTKFTLQIIKESLIKSMVKIKKKLRA